MGQWWNGIHTTLKMLPALRLRVRLPPDPQIKKRDTKIASKGIETLRKLTKTLILCMSVFVWH